MITIVGLGPGDPQHLTREALDVFEAAGEVWLRTIHHPLVPDLPAHLEVHSFDDLYDQAVDFEQVYAQIAEQVLELGRREAGVVYAVPGHPLVGEAAVQLIRQRAAAADQCVRIVAGLSFIEPVLTALGVDALAGLQIFDALELATCYHPPLNPDFPALLGQLYSRVLAADVKLTLMNQYPDEHQVALVDAAGTAAEQVTYVPLHQMDHEEVNHLTTLYVPPLPAVSGFEGLQGTVAHLRAPDGCPWDREQTHASLRGGLLEETYEVLEAIDQDDTASLREELGDLLLQIVLHTQIATEEGAFNMAAVIYHIDAKLKHRHPHVWGDRPVSGTDEVLARWEDLKRQEKQERQSVLDGVPQALPALQQADVYGRRVARVGFDWPYITGVVEKVHEEIGEINAATTPQEQQAEIGDLLFAVVNWARWMDIDPESALREANARFAARFRAVERMVEQQGQDMKALSIEDLEALWQRAKRQ